MLTRIFASLLLLAVTVGCSGADNSALPGAAQSMRATTRHDVERPLGPSSTATFDEPREVIPIGRFRVDIMEFAAPRRFTELAQRTQQAMREYPEWWQDHIRNATPGEPLAYDQRLGLSEKEYDEYLSMSNKIVMRKKGEAMLTVANKAEDVYVLDGGNSLPNLTGIEIDLKNDVARTPFGDGKGRSEIKATAKSAFGPWKVVQWNLEHRNPDGITSCIVKLALGKLDRSGRGILYYDVKGMHLGSRVRISQVLHYDLPAKQ